MLDRLRRRATPRDRQIFGLYFLQGMTAREIAELPDIGLTVKGVEAVIHRLRKDFSEDQRE